MTRLHARIRAIMRWLWGTAAEPRIVTALVSGVYAATATTALATGLRHPAGGGLAYPYGWTHSLAVLLLTGGGISGAVWAWRGEWAMERIAVVATTSGMWWAAAYTALQPHAHGPILVDAAALVGTLAWTTLAALRWLRVTQATFAPRLEDTILTPRQIADLNRVLRDMAAETGGRKGADMGC